MAMLNGGNIVQWDVEEPIDVFVGMPGGHRGDDFVEMQIRETTSRRINAFRCAALWEQDAGKARHLFAHLPSTVNCHNVRPRARQEYSVPSQLRTLASSTSRLNEWTAGPIPITVPTREPRCARLQ